MYGLKSPSTITANFLSESRTKESTNLQTPSQKNSKKYKWEIVWINVFLVASLHIIFVYGLYLIATTARVLTFFWNYFYLYFCGLGVTAGAHRLWAHKTYKAKLPLKIMLAIFNTSAFQLPLFDWVRDHRVHHKFTDTDADPHNATRGFFFSHVGWLLLKKHDDLKEKGKTVDVSDLLADPIVMFQKKYFYFFMPFLTFLIPAFVPWYFWNEPFDVAVVICFVRYTFMLNGTWAVNSVAHIWGNKPYDKTISSTQSHLVSLITYGEGWHNYHHIFPWDYKTSELGNYRLNWTTWFIDLMAKIGWAYDLKTASVEMIKKRIERTGDGSCCKNKLDNFENDSCIWGWGDKDMKKEEIEEVNVCNRLKND